MDTDLDRSEEIDPIKKNNSNTSYRFDGEDPIVPFNSNSNKKQNSYFY